MSEKFKVAVIGGGAAGLIAAATAADTMKGVRDEGKIVILEGNSRPGKKLLATGNGRCNLTNLNISEKFYHGDIRYGAELLKRFSASTIMDKFAQLGIVCRSDNEGRIYPTSLQAACVLQLLVSACEEAGVLTVYGFNVVSVVKARGGFALKAENGEEIWAQRVILASGGAASPKHSCGQRGYDIARELGHEIVPCRPALTPIKTSSRLVRELKGMRCRVHAQLYRGNKLLRAESGEVIFSEQGLSGICIFELSANAESGDLIQLDLARESSHGELIEYMERLRKWHPLRRAEYLLAGLINMKIAARIVTLCGIDRNMPLSKLSEKSLIAVANKVKALSFEVTGIGGWETAQVTAGGVALKDVSMTSMESKVQSGIYFAGEILNINGDCGGYNLHWAWSTGITAGRAAAMGNEADT